MVRVPCCSGQKSYSIPVIDVADPEKSSTASAIRSTITNKAAAARAIVAIVSPLGV